VRRDVSLVLPEQIRYEAVASLVQRVNPPNLEDLEYVTTYRGKPLEKGQKSVTSTLIFRSSSGTLTSEQVEDAVQKVISAAKSELNATLRT
jgi:phenylalanyl-tRNA synthetase beta chain